MLLLLLLSCTGLSAGGGVPLASLPHGGSLKGVTMESFGGKKFAAFLGIPYAKSPQRFKVADDAESWEGIRDADKAQPDCLQYSEMTLEVHGTENCLFANVYTPKGFNETKTPYDVIVYIHGGGFSFQYGHYGPKYLLDYDVILVTFTYRVGPLGFLSTGDEALPGNLGLKDQNALLRWVKRNIGAFGGNKDNVLLSGTSAGGVSVHYHMLSKLSRGLFHRAFSMSGAALCCWAQTENSKEKAQLIARKLGCGDNLTSQQLVSCLSEKRAEDIMGQMKRLQRWGYFPFTPLGPVVEPPSEGAFLTARPSDVIRNGGSQAVPWLASLVSEEGLFPVADFIANRETLMMLQEKWEELAPSLLDFEYTTKNTSREELAKLIWSKYFKTVEEFKSGINCLHIDTRDLIDMCSDRLFRDGVVRAIELHSKHTKSPVYSYYFTYRGKHSSTEYVAKNTENYGVAHGDDTGYIFQNELINTEDSEEDKKMIKLLTEMVVNFAKNGKPSLPGVDWPEAWSPGNLTYVEIKSPNELAIASSEDLGRSKLWASFGLAED